MKTSVTKYANPAYEHQYADINVLIEQEAGIDPNYRKYLAEADNIALGLQTLLTDPDRRDVIAALEGGACHEIYRNSLLDRCTLYGFAVTAGGDLLLLYISESNKHDVDDKPLITYVTAGLTRDSRYIRVGPTYTYKPKHDAFMDAFFEFDIPRLRAFVRNNASLGMQLDKKDMSAADMKKAIRLNLGNFMVLTAKHFIIRNVYNL